MMDWMAGPRRPRIRAVEVDGQALRLGVRLGTPDDPPLLICNGILREPGADGAVRDRSGGIETVVFDVPRCGRVAGNLRYRSGGLARLANRLMAQLGYEARVRVLGVSWGGALAQQSAFHNAALPPPRSCRHIAGRPHGAGSLSAIGELFNPRRYSDPEFLGKVGPELSGGGFRRKPDLLLDPRPPLRRATRGLQPLAAARRLGLAQVFLAATGPSRRWSWRAPRIGIVSLANARVVAHSLVRRGFM